MRRAQPITYFFNHSCQQHQQKEHLFQNFMRKVKFYLLKLTTKEPVSKLNRFCSRGEGGRVGPKWWGERGRPEVVWGRG